MPQLLLQVAWRSADGFRGAIPVAVTFRPFLAPRNLLPWTPDFVKSYKASSATAQKVRLTPFFQRASVLTGTVNNGASIDFFFTVDKPIVSRTGMVWLVAAEYEPETDLDLVLFRKDPESGTYVPIGESAGPDANEQLMIVGPGEYKAEVVAYYLPSASTPVTLYQSAIYADGSNNTPGFKLSVSPTQLHTDPADPCCCTVTTKATGANSAPPTAGPNDR